MAIINLDILKQTKTLETLDDNVIYSDLELDVKKRYPLSNELEKSSQINDIIPATNIKAIINSFTNLLTTSPGEKILNPLFGINFGDLLFLPVSEERADVIGTNIINNIERFEPRIKLQKLEITPNIDDQEYICDFIYTIPRFNNEQLNLKGRLSSSGFYV